jgi:hypothetical protein
MTTLLSTTYFGPVQWYQKLYRSEEVQIEQWESFQKQTYRNRCLIATTNGVQALTVPVERHIVGDCKSPTTKETIRDIRISDHGNWRHLHWNALQSAYGESPFFEYYQDDIYPFFEKRWTFLLDFNEEIRQKMCELIDIQPKVCLTNEYIAEAQVPTGMVSYREAICPKHPVPDPDFTPKPYYQVYQQKHGFLENLSILDLLFNLGPESIFYL